MNEKSLAKMREYRKLLQELTNGLVMTAQSQKRDDYRINGLLREYYDLVGKKLYTFDEWKEQNYSIKKGEHAYHFWGKPIARNDGNGQYCPIAFLFSQDQVMINAVAA